MRYSCLLGILVMISAVSAQESPKEILNRFRSAGMKGGDSAAGEKVFRSEKAGCTKCHTTGEKKRLAGPDLNVIGDKFDRNQLIKSVLEPSARIHPDHATVSLVLKSGRVVNGVLKRRTDESVELFDEQGNAQSVSVDDIEEQRGSKTSLMPAGLHKLMDEQQFADLIAWLETKTQPDSDHPGIPSQISSATKSAELKVFADGFDHPVWLTPKPGEHGTWIVVEQKTCKAWQLKQSAGDLTRSVFVDMSSESISGVYEGVMCLAFHPDFEKNGLYYLNHHVREEGVFSPVIVERQATEDRSRDSGRATRRLIRIKQETDLHWGGMLAFGPDNLLYIGAGDGGPQEDPDGHGQNTKTWQGKILRIDVDGRTGDKAYGIPDSNPFVGRTDVLPEIWGLGFRMPWRFSWDNKTNEMWVGDIGQNLFEEVTIARKGGNHGWNVYEGFTHFSDRYRRQGDSYVPPVFSYRRRLGVSVTGGYVYRGTRNSSLTGCYIFGDFETKYIWALRREPSGGVTVRRIAQCPQKPCSFGIDQDGEVFVIGYQGTIYRLVVDGVQFP